jgi:hypothetical protein
MTNWLLFFLLNFYFFIQIKDLISPDSSGGRHLELILVILPHHCVSEEERAVRSEQENLVYRRFE